MARGSSAAEFVCLPGLMCTDAAYERVLEAVPGSARVLALATCDDFEAIARDVIGRLHQPSVLCGMSMGAYVALRVAKLAPERVLGLVLIGATAASDNAQQAALRGKVVEWTRRKGLDALAASQAGTLLASANAEREDLRRLLADMNRSVGMDTFARHQAALAARPDMTGDLADIDCPALVLTGREDRVNGPDVGGAMAAAMQRAEFFEIADAGHLPVLEAPAEVARRVNAFLGRFAREAA